MVRMKQAQRRRFQTDWAPRLLKVFDKNKILQTER